MSENTFFLYARKSTDQEDKQILSIESQLTELRSFADKEGLQIAEEFVEKESAQTPGRKVFENMCAKIESSEVSGIIAWHPDRLARNSVDGGKIMHLLDTGRLAQLKFPSFWFEDTPQGKFMLNIAFSQSQYYVDSLSENTKRGLRQKVRRGEYPGKAPLGYLNDVKTKTIVVDPKVAPLIEKCFEKYNDGATQKELADFLANHGVKSRNENTLHRDRISSILKNPFYIGLFEYKDETHEGKHEPVIKAQLFEEVQNVLKKKSGVRKSKTNNPQALCGLLKCAECGCSITAEVQKGHVYYRCTKKRGACSQKYLREEALAEQLSKLIKERALKPAWADKMLERLEKEKQDATRDVAATRREKKSDLSAVSQKLEKLLNLYLDSELERGAYTDKKQKLLQNKKKLKESIETLDESRPRWLERFGSWIRTAQKSREIATDGTLEQLKTQAKEIFGSNLRLADKIAQGVAVKPHSFIPKSANSCNFVPGAGIEPACQLARILSPLCIPDSTTRACNRNPVIILPQTKYKNLAYFQINFLQRLCAVSIGIYPLQ